MPAPRNQELGKQIAADPRVVELANSRARGSIPGRVTASELRRFGYNVPDDWKYTSNLNPRNPRNPSPGVYEEHDKWDTIIWGAAAGVATYGVASAVAAGPAAASSTTPAAGGLPPLGTVPAATAPTTVASASGWSRALPYIFGGAEAVGNYLGARADRNAAVDDANRNEQLERDRLAEDTRRYEESKKLEAERYSTRRGDLAPYRAMGDQARPALQQRLGLNNPGATPPSMYVRASGFGQPSGAPPQSGPQAPPQPPTASTPGEHVPTPREEAPPGPPPTDPNVVPASQFGQPPPMSLSEMQAEWLRQGGFASGRPMPGGFLPSHRQGGPVGQV